MSRFDEARTGQPEREGPAARPAAPATEGGRGGDGWRAEEPVLLGSAAPARQPELPEDSSPHRQPVRTAMVAPKPVPRGWPSAQAEPVWSWLARPRPPLPVLVGGAEGGVGTSTVTALLGDVIAAASPGPTVIVDQCGTTGGSMIRRLVGQRGGLDAHEAVAMLRHRTPAPVVMNGAPHTSAGAALLDDGRGYTPLAELFRLVQTTCGALIVDGGRADAVLAARMNIRPLVVIVGRADVIGAEAICAALGALLDQPTPVRPVVVLSSTASTDRRRIQAATKLVATAGISHLVHLPYDARLASGQPLRLDQVGKSTAAAGLQVVSLIGKTQEVLNLVRRPDPPTPAPTAPAAPG